MRPALLVLAAAAVAIGPSARADDADVRQLLADVRELSFPGEPPAPVATFAPGAFPLAVGVRADGVRLPVIAAARWLRGRLVAVGSSSILSAAALAQPGPGAFLTNAARWVSAGHPGAVVLVVDSPAAAQALEKAGLKTVSCTLDQLRERIEAPDFEAVVLDTAALDTRDGRRLGEFLSAFVRRGGGAILTGNGRLWSQSHPAGRLSVEQGANQLTAPMGVAWTTGSLAPTETGWLVADAASADSRLALQALWRHADGVAKVADSALQQTTAAAAAPVLALPALESWYTPRATALCRKYPIRFPVAATQPTARLQCSLDLRAADIRGPEKAIGHAAGNTFPGLVPVDAPRRKQTVSVDLATAGWQGLGVYAAPGDTVTITVPASETGRGLRVMIGVHAAALWDLPTWERFPQVTVQRPLTSAITRIGSSFGGPVRIYTPGVAGRIEITIDGAVEAPRFVAGVTDGDAWGFSRRAPGPWTELVGAHVTLSVPTPAARASNDPAAPLAFWDDAVDAVEKLLGTRRRVQLVVDAQSTGEIFLENHVAVLATDATASRLLDPSVLRGADPAALWDEYVAVGRVAARDESVFSAETRALLAAQRLAERNNGATEAVLPELSSEKRSERRAKFLEAGATAEAWKSDPRLGFGMLYALRQAFGWEPLAKGFAASAGASDPAGAWVIQVSRAVNRNVALYAEAWGIPVSPAAKNAVARLPRWMPADWPKR